MFKVRNVVLLLLVFSLAACSSPSPIAPTPQPASVNLDNDFWFDTVSSPGSSEVVYVGFGFSQTGNAVLGDFISLDAHGEPDYYCQLAGSVNGDVLNLRFTDASNDQIKVSGTFGAGAKTLTGKLAFVVAGQVSSYTLELTYESELDTNALSTQGGALSVKDVLQRLR